MRRTKIILFILTLSLLSYFVSASSVGLIENTTWQSELTAVRFSAIALGDVDNDGDMDLALTGCSGTGACGTGVSKIYTNNGTSFEENSTWQSNLTGAGWSSIAFGDIDNDGNLDLIITGCDSSTSILTCDGTPSSKVYINNGTGFAENSTWGNNLQQLMDGCIALGDIDLDGKLDLAVIGKNGVNNKVAGIYINDGVTFVENSTWQSNLDGVYQGSVGLVDYDNDGDLDLAITGDRATSDKITKIYTNDGTTFNELQSLLAVDRSALAFGNYNNDSYMDLALIGQRAGDHFYTYSGNGSSFVQDQISGGGVFIGLFRGSIAWGDYDNDGNLDIVGTGKESDRNLIYNNSDGVFERDLTASTDLRADNLQRGALTWGDYDNDSDLDLIVTGIAVAPLARTYSNNVTITNTHPNASTDFNTSYVNNELTLQWGNASDDETATLSLYYNLKVGNASGSNSIVSGVYGGSSGGAGGGGPAASYFGNMMQRKSITLKNIDISGNETIYWSVQTIDTGLKAGDWSAEQNYTFPVDITLPVITLNAPVDQLNTTNATITFNATVYDGTNLTNVSLYGNWGGWHSNETNSSGDNDTDYLFTKNLTAYGDGNYQWRIEAYDETNNSRNSSIRNFRIDTTYPVVNLVTPTNAFSWTSSQTVTFTYNVTDLAILNCSLIIDGAIDQNDTSIAVNTAQTFSKTLSNGDYSWSVNCTDTVNYENASETRNLTVSYTAPTSNGGGGSSVTGSTVPLVCMVGAIKCIGLTQYQECLAWGTINKWNETKYVPAGKECKFGALTELEEEIPPTPPQPSTEEEINATEEVVEEIPLEEKSRKYVLWVALVIIIGFGYLIYYEVRHLKR